MNLRKAILEDAETLYNWAISADARINAINNEFFSFENHLTWFTNKLKSFNTSIFILEDFQNKVGQIRFDLIEGFYEIDFFIDSKYRGKGLGKSIVKMGINKLNCSKFKAKVLNSNLPSQKVFESLNFTKQGSTFQNQKEFFVYILET